MTTPKKNFDPLTPEEMVSEAMDIFYAAWDKYEMSIADAVRIT